MLKFTFQKWLITIQLFLRQSALSLNINLPIGELLFLINKSFCDYLIDAKQMSKPYLQFFWQSLKSK